MVSTPRAERGPRTFKSRGASRRALAEEEAEEKAPEDNAEAAPDEASKDSPSGLLKGLSLPGKVNTRIDTEEEAI